MRQETKDYIERELSTLPYRKKFMFDEDLQKYYLIINVGDVTLLDNDEEEVHLLKGCYVKYMFSESESGCIMSNVSFARSMYSHIEFAKKWRHPHCYVDRDLETFQGFCTGNKSAYAEVERALSITSEPQEFQLAYMIRMFVTSVLPSQNEEDSYMQYGTLLEDYLENQSINVPLVTQMLPATKNDILYKPEYRVPLRFQHFKILITDEVLRINLTAEFHSEVEGRMAELVYQNKDNAERLNDLSKVICFKTTGSDTKFIHPAEYFNVLSQVNRDRIETLYGNASPTSERNHEIKETGLFLDIFGRDVPIKVYYEEGFEDVETYEKIAYYEAETAKIKVYESAKPHLRTKVKTYEILPDSFRRAWNVWKQNCTVLPIRRDSLEDTSNTAVHQPSEDASSVLQS